MHVENGSMQPRITRVLHGRSPIECGRGLEEQDDVNLGRQIIVAKIVLLCPTGRNTFYLHYQINHPGYGRPIIVYTRACVRACVCACAVLSSLSSGDLRVSKLFD